MSFRLRIDRAESLGGETRIHGVLVEGAYFGPQYVRFTSATGIVATATIVSHELIEPRAWPITARADARVVLYLASPDPHVAMDAGGVIEGLGSVLLRSEAVDLSGELSNPLFWGNFAVLHMDSDAFERPDKDLLGLYPDNVDGYYTDVISPLIDSSAWPIFQLEIDGDRYVEAEWAGGAEYQNRLWIGSKASGQRALLGYNSGHFSLPGLRPSELVGLIEMLERGKAHPAAGLLLAPLCYLPAPEARLTGRLADLCARIPGVQAGHAATLACNLTARLVVPDAVWERRPDLGWCSTSPYSQRNPESAMSVLSEVDFRFIRQFLADVR
jgi:hypothetical protein